MVRLYIQFYSILYACSSNVGNWASLLHITEDKMIDLLLVATSMDL
jgi:hypothetical protein